MKEWNWNGIQVDSWMIIHNNIVTIFEKKSLTDHVPSYIFICLLKSWPNETVTELAGHTEKGRVVIGKQIGNNGSGCSIFNNYKRRNWHIKKKKKKKMSGRHNEKNPQENFR